MLLSSKYRFCFIATRKTGSTSAQNILTPNSEVALLRPDTISNLPLCTHAIPQEIDAYFSENLRQNFLTLTIVRDPIERFVSGYSYNKRPTLADKTHPKHTYYTGKISFEEYVDRFESGDLPDFQMNCCAEDFDAILRLDCIEEDAACISEFLPSDFCSLIKATKLNRSKSRFNFADMSTSLYKKLKRILANEYELYNNYGKITARAIPPKNNLTLVSLKKKYPDIYHESVLGHAINLKRGKCIHEAAGKLERLESQRCLDSWGRSMLADCYMELGDEKSFSSIVEKLIDTDSQDLGVWFQIARYHYINKRFKESFNILTRAMERCFLPMKYYYFAFQSAKGLKSLSQMKRIVELSCKAHPGDKRLVDLLSKETR
ncbi:sulfotransferase family 2 domain-containing protein [Desulfogranum marinum]|uniref:sulfotransferase family 2 domain-containing protein n=1 Tax=Desulfogranum marinum TaxID=453220 RepID=UPI001962FDB2|nr:sulfotransferase family 2 domain-containing protein [Desulfogranum marinum]MBM9513708.1 sulfotransferase family 2 domain-containing protein [Desulfogranum marinum]